MDLQRRLSPNWQRGARARAWGAVQTYFSLSVADFLQVNDLTKLTGTSCGNNAASGRTLGAGNAALFSNIAVAEIVYANTLPTADQLAMLTAYRLRRYGF